MKAERESDEMDCNKGREMKRESKMCAAGKRDAAKDSRFTLLLIRSWKAPEQQDLVLCEEWNSGGNRVLKEAADSGIHHENTEH
ncbi:hypothetical protein JOB18_005903 [Solea senegalensis]|uniref:Uncharacterized protein n=1 Tax=Solea senegalensis TaxID=28829 RepID=A0AAV6QSF1_SOLSE|nr:hypothetical protein JOB18_005903 [Solea senegalensis]